MRTHVAQHRASPAPDVANTFTDRVGSDTLETGARIVRVFMHAWMDAVKIAVLFRRKERGRLAEFRELGDMPAPYQCGCRAEQRRVAQGRGQQVLEDEANLIGLFTPHGPKLALAVPTSL